MKTSREIVIVTAFGRGHWLASELADLSGIKVTLVDVSESLGRWTPEDREGPFGFFQSDQLTQTQIGRLSAEDYHDTHTAGITIWLPSGPKDFKGPLTQFWLDQSEDIRFLKEFYNRVSDPAKRLNSSFFDDQPFEKSWLVHLSHQLSASEFRQNARSAAPGLSHLPFFSSWSTRRVSRKGYQRLLDWCKGRGVQVFSEAEVVDVDSSTSSISSLELKSASYSGVLKPDQVVWCLTQGELRMIGTSLYEKIYDGPVVEPEWAWLRYRLQLDLDDYDMAIPDHFLMIENSSLPWTHDNMLMAQKVVTGAGFDVWLRIPYHQRFQRKVLEDYARHIEVRFQDRIPDSNPQTLEMPQEFHYDFSELGPSLFPVYGLGQKRRIRPKSFRNVKFSAPDNWELLDWTGRFQHENSIFDELSKWQKSLEARANRQESEIDTEIHAP